VDIDFTLPWRVTVVTPGKWQRRIRTGGVWWLAVANGLYIFQMLLVCTSNGMWAEKIAQTKSSKNSKK